MSEETRKALIRKDAGSEPGGGKYPYLDSLMPVKVSEEPEAQEQAFPLGLTEYQAVNLRWALDEIRQGSPLNTGDWVCEIMLALEGMDLQSEPNGYSVAPTEPVESEPVLDHRCPQCGTVHPLLSTAEPKGFDGSCDSCPDCGGLGSTHGCRTCHPKIVIAEPRGAREAHRSGYASAVEMFAESPVSKSTEEPEEQLAWEALLADQDCGTQWHERDESRKETLEGWPEKLISLVDEGEHEAIEGILLAVANDISIALASQPTATEETERT